MGEVLKYIDTHLNRPTAVKFINSTQIQERLADEIRALTSLRSKHVVEVFDIIKGGDSNIGIVMEYIDGCDLNDLNLNEYSFDQRLNIIWQIANGIKEIHAQNVIHRDLKLQNIRMDNEGVIKIFDFGLARSTGIDAQTLGYKGTIVFSAPELYSQGVVNFTPSIDVYAFGIISLVLLGLDIPNELLQVPPVEFSGDCFNSERLSVFLLLKKKLNDCLSFNPNTRPHISEIEKLLRTVLTYDKHIALMTLVGNDKAYTVNSMNRNVTLSSENNRDKFSLEYNGFDFSIHQIHGEVYINNMQAFENQVIPDSIVVSLGGPHRDNRERSFVTFDVSQPEVSI